MYMCTLLYGSMSVRSVHTHKHVVGSPTGRSSLDLKKSNPYRTQNTGTGTTGRRAV